MLDKKRKKKNNVQKIHFQNVWHVLFLFLLCYLDSHLSSCASRPFFKTKGGDIKSLTVSFLFFFSFIFPPFFFAEMERLSSFNARENHWPSLFSFFFFCFSTQ